MSHIGKCELCGKQKEYKYKSHIKRFCSHKCSNKWKWDTVREKAETKKITCEYCKQEFEKAFSFLRQHPDTKFCSRECAGLSARTRYKIKCKTCGKVFEDTRGSYCSKECSNEGRKKENPKWENKEFLKEYHRAYQKENREIINKKSREYNKTEKGRIIKKTMQLRRRSAGSLTAGQTEELLLKADGKCYWCKKEHKGNYHIDHYVPIAKGGKTDLDNLVVACAKCNRQKSAKNPIDFANSIGRLL